jgi:small GTP-binding protein
MLNLGILAHVDAGKTTLTERLLYASGVIDQLGSVDAGTTQTDLLPLERQRGITIKSAVASFPIGDVAVNLIDTPGHPDFIAEVDRVLNVLDGVVLVISAVEGVQPQTRILMRSLQRLQIPALLFVNKIDRPGARAEGVLQEISERLGVAAIAMGSWRPPGPVARRSPLQDRVTPDSQPVWLSCSLSTMKSSWPHTCKTSRAFPMTSFALSSRSRRDTAGYIPCSTARRSPGREWSR